MKPKTPPEPGFPPDFLFSQASLQDYVDCPRRFQLRYLLGVAWPAVESEPILEQERHMQQGAAFHRLVQQHLAGISVARLSALARNTPGDDLQRWWQNYLDAHPAEIPGTRHIELALAATLGGRRLVARYDLFVVRPGERITIFDWKTNRRRPPDGKTLARLQTRVYRYLAVAAAAHLNGGQAVRPEQVEMVYWYAEFPDRPERLPYDALQYQADEAYLRDLMAEIAANQDEVFHLTDDARRCLFCPYRSLCDRGVRAGDFEVAPEAWESEPGAALEIDFESTPEISF